jgi:hypothetical protein
MPETISCPQCRRPLNVPAELIGQLVKCPACATTFRADLPGAPPPRRAVQPEPAYPPEERRGRRAGDYDRPSRRYEEDEDYGRGRRPSRTDSLDFGPVGRPHRGGLILTLGILSLVLGCCPLAGWILGGYALSMANQDLVAMASRRMDRSGQGLTQAGKVCGIIGLVLATLSFAANMVRILGGIR